MFKAYLVTDHWCDINDLHFIITITALKKIMDAVPKMFQKISFIVEHQVTHVEGAIKSL